MSTINRESTTDAPPPEDTLHFHNEAGLSDGEYMGTWRMGRVVVNRREQYRLEDGRMGRRLVELAVLPEYTPRGYKSRSWGMFGTNVSVRGNQIVVWA